MAFDLDGAESPPEVFVLVAVTDVLRKEPCVTIHPDPWTKLVKQGLYHTVASKLQHVVKSMAMIADTGRGVPSRRK